MNQFKILIVEDEELMRSILTRLLTGEGYDVRAANTAEAALEIFAHEEIDATLTDIKMPGMDGLQLLERLKSAAPETPVIMMTAFSSVDTAIAALRKGAYDYITKPFVNEDLLQTVKNAVRTRELSKENLNLRRELSQRGSFEELIGTSRALKEVTALIEKVSTANVPILITGESGTGKELVARAIHRNSPRHAHPFIAVNCGALPETLLESELFGHTKGAFTDAKTDKKGLFRSAEGGTILLDEIAEIPSSLQVKLLRALQEHEVTPVGSSLPVKFNARIIAATNRNLETEIAEGRFREDLFYRLNVLEIFLPPLRERREDIPSLAEHFAQRIAREQNAPDKKITQETMNALVSYNWQGNIRELQNAIERAFILSDEEIEANNLPPRVRLNSESATDNRQMNGTPSTLEEIERRYILETIETTEQDKARAADILGIDLSTLYRKLKRYGEEF